MFLICVYISASADKINDLIKKAGTSKEYPGSNVLIVFDSTRVDMQESGLSYYNTHILYKILTTDGAKELSTIILDYEPGSAFVDIKSVIIYRTTGEPQNITKEKYYDYAAPARSIYWGARQKMIDIGRLDPGDAVEIITFKKGYTYALLTDDDDKYIPPMRGHFYDIVEFWSERPVKIKYYELTVPKTKTVQYEIYNGKFENTKTETTDKFVFKFTSKEIKPIEKEKNMVALSDVAPKLLLSTSPDWKAKSKWFYGVNEDYKSFVPTEEVKAKTKELLKGAKTEADSVAVLTHWVADNMRYSGISMGKGEGYTLHNAKMNYTDRCGVCKDKASLLVSMLRAAGFEAYAAMTMAGSRIDKIPADQFNHSVTAVRLKDGKLHMLDPTWVPFVREVWSSAEQQQNYLVGTKEGEDLMKTEISPAENHYIRINAQTKLLENGTLQGTLTLEAEGQSDNRFRRILMGVNQKDRYNAMEKEFLKISPLFKIDSLYFPYAYDYSKPIKIYVKFTIPEYALVTPEEILFVPLSATQIFETQNMHLGIDTKIEKRKYAFKDACSRLVEINETIELPKYSKILDLPVAEPVSGTGADFEGNYKTESNLLKFKQKAVFKKRVYEPEDWDSYRKTVLAQKKMAEQEVILVK